MHVKETKLDFGGARDINSNSMMFFCYEYETQFLINGCRTHDEPGLKGIRF